MSDPKKIPPGAYRLDRDVQNPSPDRRHTRDWRKSPWWKAGTQFVVKELRMSAGQLQEHVADATRGLRPDHATAIAGKIRDGNAYTVVELAGDRWATNHRVGPGDREQYEALAAALVPCPEESLHQFMTRIGCESGFAEWLVEHGYVRRADLERWWHRYQYGDDSVDAEAPGIELLPVHDEVPASTPLPPGPFAAMPAIPVEGDVGASWRDDDDTLDGHGDDP